MLRALLDRRQPGFWLSAGAHGALLLAAVLSFSSSKLPDADEGIPVEVLTDNQFSEITKGETNAAKPMPNAKPRVDRVADTAIDKAPGEAKRDTPAPPKRPAEMKLADEDAEPAAAALPPQRTTEVRPELPPPPPPTRPDTVKADAAKADAAKADAAKADAAKAAQAKAEAAKAEAEKLADQREAEAIEQAKIEVARKAVAQKAEEARKATEAKKVADAKLAAAKAKAEADAEAKAEAQAEMKALADAAAKQEAAEQAKEQAKKLAEAKAVEKAKADAAAKAKALAQAKADTEAKARRQAELADKFSAGDIGKLLASKDPHQSSGATGREVNRTASLGTNTGTSQRLNPSQRDQIMGVIREQLIRCWQPPIALQNAANPPVPKIRISLKEDGSLRADPSVENNSADALFRSTADSAVRATRRCAPLRIPAQFAPYYQDWKDLVVGFYSDSMG